MLLASQLGTAEVAAQTVILQTAGLAYMAPMGTYVICYNILYTYIHILCMCARTYTLVMSNMYHILYYTCIYIHTGIAVSTSSLVGNFIGAKKTGVAIKIGTYALILDFITQSLIGLCIYYLGQYFVAAYTDDSIIQHICDIILPFLSLFTLIDGLAAVGSGVLRGGGKQLIGAILNVISFYMIGIPVAYYLCFHTILEVRGLMMGLSVGTCFQIIVLLILIFGFQTYTYSSSTLVTTTDERGQNYDLADQVDADEEDEDESGDDENNSHNNIIKDKQCVSINITSNTTSSSASSPHSSHSIGENNDRDKILPKNTTVSFLPLPLSGKATGGDALNPKNSSFVSTNTDMEEKSVV